MSVIPPISDHLTAQSPWPGLRAFTEDEQDYFFGRERETAELLRLVQRSAVVVLYGQSGLGKTSLLRAALFPGLTQHDYLPLRKRLDHGDQAPPLAAQIKAALAAELDRLNIQAPRPEANETLWEYFHRRDVDFWGPRNRLLIPVIVLDQFEEVFTLGQRNEQAAKRVEEFAAELESLLEHRPPEAVRARFEANPDEAAQFDLERRSVKFIISLREDFLAQLDPWRERMPSLLPNRYRLERMSGAQAFQVVQQAGTTLVEPEVARRIVGFVSASRRQRGMTRGLERAVVDPALLCVVCDELNRRRIAQHQAQISAELLNVDGESIIRDFYDRAFEKVDERVRSWVEDKLLTESGYRQRAALDDALKEGLPEEEFNFLVDRRILHREERDNVIWLELTHDLLTDPARRSRVERQQRLQADAAKKTAAEAIARQARTQRQLLWARIWTGVFVSLTVLAVIAFFYAISASSRAALELENLQITQKREQALAESMAGDRINKLEDDLVNLPDGSAAEASSRVSMIDSLYQNDPSLQGDLVRAESLAAEILYQNGLYDDGLKDAQESVNAAEALLKNQNTDPNRLLAAEANNARGDGLLAQGNLTSLNEASASYKRAQDIVAGMADPELNPGLAAYRLARAQFQAALGLADISYRTNNGKQTADPIDSLLEWLKEKSTAFQEQEKKYLKPDGTVAADGRENYVYQGPTTLNNTTLDNTTLDSTKPGSSPLVGYWRPSNEIMGWGILAYTLQAKNEDNDAKALAMLEKANEILDCGRGQSETNNVDPLAATMAPSIEKQDRDNLQGQYRDNLRWARLATEVEYQEGVMELRLGHLDDAAKHLEDASKDIGLDVAKELNGGGPLTLGNDQQTSGKSKNLDWQLGQAEAWHGEGMLNASRTNYDDAINAFNRERNILAAIALSQNKSQWSLLLRRDYLSGGKLGETMMVGAGAAMEEANQAIANAQDGKTPPDAAESILRDSHTKLDNATANEGKAINILQATLDKFEKANFPESQISLTDHARLAWSLGLAQMKMNLPAAAQNLAKGWAISQQLIKILPKQDADSQKVRELRTLWQATIDLFPGPDEHPDARQVSKDYQAAVILCQQQDAEGNYLGNYLPTNQAKDLLWLSQIYCYYCSAQLVAGNFEPATTNLQPLQEINENAFTDDPNYPRLLLQESLVNSQLAEVRLNQGASEQSVAALQLAANLTREAYDHDSFQVSLFNRLAELNQWIKASSLALPNGDTAPNLPREDQSVVKDLLAKTNPDDLLRKSSHVLVYDDQYRPLDKPDYSPFRAISENWRNLTGKEEIDEFNKLAKSEGVFKDYKDSLLNIIHELPLTFWADHAGAPRATLFEVDVGPKNKTPRNETTGVLTYVRYQHHDDQRGVDVEKMIALQSDAAPFADLAKEMRDAGYLRLDSEGQVALYLEFSMDYIQSTNGDGEKNRQKIINGVDDVKFRWDAGSTERDDLAKNVIKPLACEKIANGAWSAIGTVQNSQDLDYVLYRIDRLTGQVDQIQENLIAGVCPILSDYIAADGLRQVRPDTAEVLIARLRFLNSQKPRRLTNIKQVEGDLDALATLQVVVLSKLAQDHPEQTKQLLEGYQKLAQAQLWSQLFLPDQGLTQNFAPAWQSVEAGLKLKPDDLGLLKTKAHILLFEGKTVEADAIYRGHRHEIFDANSGETWERAILNDIDDFKKVPYLSDKEFDELTALFQ